MTAAATGREGGPTVPSHGSPRRITFFLPALEGGGAERVTLTIAEGLATRGHDVELVVGHLRGSLAQSLPPNLRVVDLGRTHISMTVGLLRRHLRQRRPDVLISALIHANLVAVAATRGLAVPLVVVEHNTMSVKVQEATDWRYLVVPLACATAYRLVDQVGAVSDGVADDLARRLRFPRGRIRVLRNPVDYASVLRQSAEPVSDPWFESDVDLVLAVGRLTAQKDFATLIRAVAALPDVRLLILGEGEERAQLTAMVAELGVAERVRLHGFVANPYPYFANASVIALSSRWEGLPTVLLEALPFSARIVSTDCPSGPHEILEGGKHGRLVPMDDAEALARAIDEARAEAPTDRTDAWSRYDLQAAVSDYEAVVDDVVRRRSGR